MKTRRGTANRSGRSLAGRRTSSWPRLRSAVVVVAVVAVVGALFAGVGPGGVSAHVEPNGSVNPVTLVSSAPGEITVTWSAPRNERAESFRINYGPSNAAFPSWTDNSGNQYVNNGAARSATLTGLTGGVEYKVRMRARRGSDWNSDWSGPWSTTQTVTVMAAEATNTVTVETASADLVNGDVPRLTLTSAEDGEIEVVWSAPTKPSGRWTDFRINWAKATDDYPSYTSSAGNAHPGVGERSHTLTGLEEGVEYKVRIRARYNTWSGPWKEARLTVAGTAAPEVAQQNEAATLVLSESSLTVVEGDTAGRSYTVKLAAAPTSSVTVTVSGHSGSDLSLSGLTGNALTFTAQNWDTAQTVTVTAGEDTDDVNDSVTLTHTPSGGGSTETATLQVTVTDNDAATPALVLSDTSLTVIEGDPVGESYTVKLASAPAANVTVTVSGQTRSDLSLSGLTGNALTFTTDNWDTAQTVTVTAGEDVNDIDDSVTLTHIVSGGASLQTAEVAVSVFDDDRTRLLVISEDTLTVSEGDATGASFTVQLSSVPSADVTVAVSGYSNSDLTLAGLINDTLTFTTGNWDTARTITVTAAEDADGTDDFVTVNLAATGGSYTHSTVMPIFVTDTKSIVLEPVTLAVPEGATGGVSYTVKLASTPTASVTVTVSGHTGSDLTLGGLTNNALTFTTDNWDAAQTVTVTAAGDADAVDDTVTLTHTPSGGGYSQTADLAVTVTDDDEAGLVFSEDTLTVPEDDTNGATYTVKLASKPTASVTVTVSGHTGSDLSLSGLTDDALTFTTDNWDAAQTVAVTAAGDADPLDDIGVLSHFASGGDYLLRQTLPVTITDDDTATPVTVETTAEDLETLEVPSLTLTSPVAGRIVMTWTAPTDVGSGVRDYRLAWKKTGFTWSDHSNYTWVAGADERRYVISRLEAGVSYDIAIRATSTTYGVRGPWKFATITVSDVVVPDDTTITTDVSVLRITHPDILLRRGAHAHIPSITLTSDKTGKIDVSWEAANLIYPFPQTGFNINWAKSGEEYRDSLASDGWATADGDARSLTISGLDTGVAYKVRVQSVNPSCCGHSANWTGAWKEATITVASTTTVRIPGTEPAVTTASLSTPSSQLAAGELPTANFESAAGGEIRVRWTKPRSTNQGFFREYRVNWTPNDGSAYPGPTARDGIALIPEGTTSHTITGLEVGEYKVRVAARYQTTYSRQHHWLGPWREATILVEQPPPTQEEHEEPEFAFQSSDPLSTAAMALTHDNIAWGDHLGTPYAVVSHDRVVLEWAKRGASVDRYKIWRKAPDDTSYTLLDTPPFHPTSGIRLAQEVPPGALGSRYYYVDRAVDAETGYEYAIQARVNRPGQGFVLTEPVELAAHTTQTQPEQSPVVPDFLEQNELGEYLLPVGPKVRVFPRFNLSALEFRVTLEAGEAYRVLIHDGRDHIDSVGHNHTDPAFVQRGTVNYIVGDVSAYDDTGQRFVPRDRDLPDHSRHVFWGVDSIRRVSDGEVITYQDTYLAPPSSSSWVDDVFLSPVHVATDAIVFHAPTAGDYTIWVSVLHAGADFGVQVVKVEDQPDVTSFGYGLDLYTRVEGVYAVGSEYRHHAVVLGNISPDDTDWFLVRLEPSKTYDVRIITHFGTRVESLLLDPSRSVEVPDWKGLTNPQLKFAGRDGVVINGPSSLTVPGDAGGYYHFGVTGASSTDTGLYVLDITERDFGTSASSALKIGAGQQVIGMLHDSRDRDWIGAWLACDKDYRVEARASGGDIGGREFTRRISLDTKVFWPSGTRVTSSAVSRYNGPSSSITLRDLYRLKQISAIDFDPPCSGNGSWYYFEVATGGGGKPWGAYYFQIFER